MRCGIRDDKERCMSNPINIPKGKDLVYNMGMHKEGRASVLHEQGACMLSHQKGTGSG